MKNKIMWANITPEGYIRNCERSRDDAYRTGVMGDTIKKVKVTQIKRQLPKQSK